MRYWEDFVVGSETIHGEHQITADEIHVDPDVEGPFGGLIASG